MRDINIAGPYNTIKLWIESPGLFWWLLRRRPKIIWQTALGRVDFHIHR